MTGSRRRDHLLIVWTRIVRFVRECSKRKIVTEYVPGSERSWRTHARPRPESTSDGAGNQRHSGLLRTGTKACVTVLTKNNLPTREADDRSDLTDLG